MSYVVGCDYSTHACDFVWVDEDTLAATWKRYELAGHDAFERARSVRGRVPGPAEWDDVLAFGIEDPAGHHGVRAVARVQGAVLTRLPPSTLVMPLAPSQWRKAVGLPGNASKDQVFDFVTESRAWDSGLPTDDLWPQDACDAYCVALATLSMLQRKEAA